MTSNLSGSQPSFHICGIPVTFKSGKKPISDWNDILSFSVKELAIFHTGEKCIKVVDFVMQNPIHVLAHEMGHALACKSFGKSPQVFIYPDFDEGETLTQSLSQWESRIVGPAGPLGNILFSTCKLAAAIAFRDYISWPVSVLLASGAVFWLPHELFVLASGKDVPKVKWW